MNNTDQDYQRSDETFLSHGVSCAAWLYQPTNIENPPVIIMAHGFAAERSFGLPAFAERFAAQGWAVFLFDYRCFGDSEGEPRNDVDPIKHSDDWDAAIDCVRSLPAIDNTRMVLWGSSFSGGHVTCAATRHPDIYAIIAQVPYTGPAGARTTPTLFNTLILFYHLTLHKLTMALTGKPHYIPAIGRPGTFAVMNTEESYDGYLAIVPADREFANQVPAGVLLKMGSYDPTALADQVHCPALVIAGAEDSLISEDKVEEMAARMPKGTFNSLACDHFSPYRGEWFEKNIEMQIEFLKQCFEGS